MPGPARGVHAKPTRTRGAAGHLNRAPGGRRRDAPHAGPKSPGRPARCPPAARRPRPALTTAAPHRRHRLRRPRPRPPSAPRAPRRRKPASPPARVFKCARPSHWPAGGGARHRATGPRPRSRPPARAGRSRLATPGREFERRPLIGGVRAAAPPPRPGRAGSPGERGAGPAGGGVCACALARLLRRRGSRRAASAEACVHPPRPWPSPRGRAPSLPPVRQARTPLLGRPSHGGRGPERSPFRDSAGAFFPRIVAQESRGQDVAPVCPRCVLTAPPGAGFTGCPQSPRARCPSGTGQCPPARLSREKRWTEEDTVVFPETLSSPLRAPSPPSLSLRPGPQGRRSLLGSRAHTREPHCYSAAGNRSTRTVTHGA